MNDTRKSDDLRLRVTKKEKLLAIRLAKTERRTLSGFILNLIHERSDYYSKAAAAAAGYGMAVESTSSLVQVPTKHIQVRRAS